MVAVGARQSGYVAYVWARGARGVCDAIVGQPCWVCCGWASVDIVIVYCLCVFDVCVMEVWLACVIVRGC